jgi:exosortase/archaeosortase family protein
VFVVIFTLMMLDLPLPWQQAIPVFLFGVVGTWLQNVIRIIIILGCGYFFGSDALWAAHFWTIYVLFPLWYLLFALVYFRFVHKPPTPPTGRVLL